MDVNTIRDMSLKRAKRWHGEDDWNLLEWAGAMCGEAGETANAAKKLRRIEQGIPSINKEPGRSLVDLIPAREKVAHEAADTILYAVLVIAKSGVDLESILREVFNAKSEEYGFPERI